MFDIKNYLPQREPFLFVDEIVQADLTLIVGQKTYDRDFIFVQECLSGEKYIPCAILLESLVQCGGAGVNMMGLGNKNIFALATVRNLKMRSLVSPPACVEMKVKTIKAAGKVLRQKGEAYANDKFVLSAEWSCIFLQQ